MFTKEITTVERERNTDNMKFSDKCDITKINDKNYNSICAECELIDEYYNWEENKQEKKT